MSANQAKTFMEWAGEVRISQELEVHRGFLDLLEPVVESALKYWQEEAEVQAVRIEDPEQQGAYSAFAADQQGEHERFKNILMNSFFASSFALFEHQVLRICYEAQTHSRTPFSVKDIGGASPVDRAKKYLETLGMNFPADGSDWQEVVKYRQIRNLLMHEGGSLPPSSSLLDYVNSKEIVSSWGGGLELNLSRAFCEEALDNLKAFLLRLNTSYARWRKSSGTQTVMDRPIPSGYWLP